MLISKAILVFVLAIVFWVLAMDTTVAAESPAMSTGKAFTVQKVADGVYAFIRNEPPSLWFNPNNGLIIGKRYAIVIDSNISSDYTREILAEIRKLTDKPIKYVINTHWHDDHVIGNRVYRDAFPNVQFIGHRSTLVDQPTTGAANRKGSVENGQGFVDFLRKQIDKGENLARKTITDEERAGYSSDIKLVESFLAESRSFETILPTVLVDDRMEIKQDGRKIEILFLGRAHTGADLVVYLPKERIVASGDLVVYPIPLIGSTSYPLEYGATLERLAALNAKIIVPGHGPVMKNDVYLKQMIRLLNSIKQQTEASAKRGETLDQMRKNIDLEEFRKLFAGDSQHKRFVFENYVFLPGTAAVSRQLLEPKKQ